MSLRHGYTDQDEQPNRDISHEYRGHGVSAAWVEKHARSGAMQRASKASVERSAKSLNRSGWAHEHKANKSYWGKQQKTASGADRNAFHRSMSNKFIAAERGARQGLTGRKKR
jgi:hypothetical protein